MAQKRETAGKQGTLEQADFTSEGLLAQSPLLDSCLGGFVTLRFQVAPLVSASKRT